MKDMTDPTNDFPEQPNEFPKPPDGVPEPPEVKKPEEARPSQENMWAAACHLATFSGYFIPFGNIIGPLVFWMIKKDEFPLVRDQGKEAMNFQISMTIYVIIAAILCFFCVGVPILIVLVIVDLVCTIIATIQASDWKKYRYPITIRFIK